ncbi:unnamed protein product [Bursaphelenchus xylophilus]|uniref:RNA-directed DNA polymerase n=2 Tax=Bursaphelenchus xylophilus TaxID=6326 RepID=A0A7I8WGJ7_BURXY|nr:unnamed protein product [Bursaphelenchus xylophilus]CAG9111184.1 unnamed protein product [Bursaphelenchus xylophilus]
MSNTQANLGKLWIFDPTKNRWASYESMLRRILAARTIEADGEKKVFLFNHIGPAAYESLEVAMNGQNMDSKSFDELCRVLTGIFEPKGLVASTRHKIFTAKQLADQTSKQFIQQVKSWSIKADFESVVNTRDFVQVQAIIAGLQDKKVKEKLLETPNLDMTKLEEIVELVEGSQSAAKEMAGSSASGTIARLDKKRQKKPLWGKSGKPKGRQGTCYTCGSSQHMQPYCPKRGQRQPPTNQGYQRRQNGRNSGIRAVLPESRYDSEVSSDEDDACLALEQEVEVRRVSIPPVWLKVKLNDIEVAMELDSGAVRSVIPKPVWEKIGRPKISSYTGELQGYGGKPLNVLGTAYIDASFGKHSVLTEMVIVRDRKGQALFGRDLIRDLKVDMGPHVNLNSVAPLEANKETENTLKNEFRELFEPGHGTYKGPAVELKFKKTPEPVFLKSRPVPFALVEKVSKELDRLEAEGSLKRVMNSDFASPLVIIPKANNEIRLCVDFKRTINPQLDVDEYPLPTPESIFQQLNGGKLFSKIDLKAAFNQLRLSEKAQEYCTISSFKGLYRYTRLPFGIASAPARFQATIEQILQGIQGVAVYLDDITVTGPDDQSHIQNLREVLKRLRDSGLRLKPEKCELFQESISLLGHELNAEGIRALPNKVEAITKMPAPKDLKQLASFLGMVQYYSRFVKGLSALAAPLNALRKKTAKWQWGRKEKEAFEKLKERLTSTELLVHYDPKIPVRLSTDASDYGLGAQLEHVYPDGNIKVIGYASRTLTPAEQNYAQIEKEGLGILFGVEKFSQYLYGRKFILQTDHEPLIRIFGPKVGLPTVAVRRLQRWAIRLMQYTFEIQYVSTDKFGNADGLSRLPDPAEKPEKFRKMEERHVLAVEAEQSWPISLSKVRKLTQGDKVLQEVLAHIRKGWPEKCPSDKLVPYFRKRHSLTIVKGCIVKGHRIVIPRELRQRILTELHGAHDGATRMYSLAQQNYWFPNMEQEIKRYVSLCADCAVVGKDNVRVPIQLWSRPNNPWERIHIDLCGPLHGKMWLIVVDSYSKWPEAIDMGRNTTSKAVISKLRNLFSIHGIPEQIVSDNGTQFTSSEMANFCRLNKIEQNFSAPEKQSSNGQAERMVQTFKNAIRKFGGDDSNISLKVTKWLFSYRITPHPATGKSPSELLMGRKLRSRLNILPRQPQKVSKGEQKAVSKYRQKLAENANKGRREKKFAQGDLVYARKFNDPRIRWIPGVVSELIGQRLLAIQTEFGVLKRHYDQVKRRVVAQESDSDSDEESQDFPQFGNGGGDIGRESHQGQISDTLKTAIERTDSEDNEMSTEESEPDFEPESFEDGTEIDESPSQDEVMESSRDTSVTPTSVAPNAGVLPRRSSRSRKSPKRLRYDPSFNQIGTVTEEWKASALCSSLDGCTRSMERNPDGQPSQFGPDVPCCQSVFPPSSEASSMEVPSRARLDHLEEM